MPATLRGSDPRIAVWRLAVMFPKTKEPAWQRGLFLWELPETGVALPGCLSSNRGRTRS
jgi:hypothetical protein